MDIVALCETYAPRLDEGLKYIGNGTAKGYGDFRKMYENKDIQGVIVATPDHWHALLTIMACAAGKDVYVEKPMTVFIDEGKWMLQAARAHKSIVTVGTQRRQGAGVKAAKAVIQAGRSGRSTTSASPRAATSTPASARLRSRTRPQASTTTCGSVRPPRSPTRRIAACTTSAGSGTTPAVR